MSHKQIDLSYFPGCSLATTASESNASLMQSARILGLNLIELEDWNCCGSSSAQTFGKDLSLGMAARNLSLVPAGRPLVVMCPRCLYYLRRAQSYLKKEPETHRALEEHWGRAIALDLKIMHFLEVLVDYGLDRLSRKAPQEFKGSKIFSVLWLHHISSRQHGKGEILPGRAGKHPGEFRGRTSSCRVFLSLLRVLLIGYGPGLGKSSG